MVAVQRHESANRKYAAAQQQVGDGQRQQEEVGRGAQLPVRADGNANEQVPAHRDDYQQHEYQPDHDRFRQVVARRRTAYVTSGHVRRRLCDVRRRRDVIGHCTTRQAANDSCYDLVPISAKKQLTG